MTFDISNVSQDKNKEPYPTGFTRVDNLLYDIALGFTLNQLSFDENISIGNKSKKLQKLKPKTELHNIINKILIDSGYRKFYEWQHEMEFMSSDGDLIEVIKYDISTGDMCFVKINGDECMITKRGLREWYED